MKEAGEKESVGRLASDVKTFIVALGKTWATYLAFLPSVASLLSTYFALDIPVHIPAWAKVSFSFTALVFASFSVWRKQFAEKENLRIRLRSTETPCLRYELSGEILPLGKSIEALEAEAQKERKWAEESIASLPNSYLGPIAEPVPSFDLDRHDYESYIDELGKYLALLDSFKKGGKYQQRCFIKVVNLGSKGDEKIRIDLSMQSSEQSFIEWPNRLLDLPKRPAGRFFPNFDPRNFQEEPFRQVITSKENFASIELRELRPGESVRLLNSGFLITAGASAEFRYRMISKHLPKPQTECFSVTKNA